MRARIAKEMQEAKKIGNNATAGISNKQLEQFVPTLSFLNDDADNPACSDNTKMVIWRGAPYVSRHQSYFDLRYYTRSAIVTYRLSLQFAALRFMESEYKCTQNMTNYLERVNPIVMVRDMPKGCYFFPELEEPAKAFALELHHNMSHGFDPPEKDFWKGENATEKYCEWLLEKVTDPEWLEEENNSYGVVAWVLFLLFLIGSVSTGAVIGFTLGRRGTLEDFDTEQKSCPIQCASKL
uniref:PBPe domain-containing protein n=1 Tax=Steinernema glaseri TaxID=37863 RepID=A0A1I7YLB9_9BILA